MTAGRGPSSSGGLPPIPWDEVAMGGTPLEYLMRAMSCDCSDGCAYCAPHVYGKPESDTDAKGS